MSDENETRDRQPEGRRPAWQSGTPRGQERVVSYESDERYWTDYLRVALPVVGLLLMLGLLVWWANSIIGNEQGTQPTSTIPSSSGVSLAQTNTPENTQQPSLTTAAVPTDSGSNGTESPATDTAGTQSPGGDATVTSGNDGETPTPACDSAFKNGDLVQISEAGNNARFRDQPNLDAGTFPLLPAGTVMELTRACYTATVQDDAGDTYHFWRARLNDDGDGFKNGDIGYVPEEYLELSP